MIHLHFYPSTASMAPNILLEEIGAPFQRVLVDRSQGVQKTQQYLRLNPNGLIPALTDGDLVHIYAANHGFNCDQRGSYNEAAATKARERTLAFFADKLA